MNSLSWFIYLAGVMDGLNMILGLAALFILGGCGMYSLINGINENELVVARFRWFATALGCILLSVLIPTKNTMYAIAASEFGEKLAGTDAVKGVTNDAAVALRQWIKRQIEPTPSKKGE